MISTPTLILLLVALAPPQEIPPGGDPAEPEESAGGIFVGTDHDAERHLHRAKQLVEAESWVSAAAAYDELLRHPDIGEFLYEAGAGHYRSVREVCRTRLLELPEEGLVAYRRLVDPDARAALDGARDLGDVAGARAILERFPASSVVEEGLRWLAGFALDHGRYADAAWAIGRRLEDDGLAVDERLRLLVKLAVCHARSGNDEGVAALRARIETEAGGERLRIAGREWNPLEFLDRLADGAAAADPSPGPDPDGPDAPDVPDPRVGGLGLLWVHPITDFFLRGEGEPPRRIVPVVGRGDVFFHDGNHAFRLDGETGLLRWKVPLRPGDSYVLPDRECRSVLTPGALLVIPGGGLVVALDPETGETLWRKSGEEIERELELSFPVVLSESLAHHGSQVIAVATSTHSEAEVYVVALDMRTGDAVWSRFIASRIDVRRRGAEIVSEGGRVYVVSDVGFVAAVDLPEGTLRWVRARSTATRRPAVLASGSVLWLDFGGEDVHGKAREMLVLDAWSGEVEDRLPGRGVQGFLGLLEGAPVGLVADGLLRFGAGEPSRIWEDGDGGSRAVLGGGALWVPTDEGIDRVAPGGDARSLFSWEDRPDGRLASNADAWRWDPAGHPRGGAGPIVVSATVEGVLAFGVRGAPPEPLPEGLDVPELVARLGDPAWPVRTEADRRLREMSAENLPPVEAALASPSAEVRWRAGEIAFEMQRRERRLAWQEKLPPFYLEREPQLLDLLTHRDPQVRREGVSDLASEGGPEIHGILKDLLADPDPPIRLQAASSLFEDGDRTGMAVIREGLAAAASRTRRSVIRLIVQHGELADAAEVEPALEDADHTVRAAAMEGLVEMQGRRAIPMLQRMAGPERDGYDRLAAVTLLQRHGGAQGLPALRRALDDESGAVRYEALRGIDRHEKLPGRETAEKLADRLVDESPTNAFLAARLLHRTAQQGSRAALIPVEKLLAAYGSKEDNVRYHVLRIAEKIGSPGTIPVLRKAAADPNPRIQLRALETLRKLLVQGRDHPGVREERGRLDPAAMARLMGTASPDARFYLIEILGEIEGADVRDALLVALADPTDRVREQAKLRLAGRADPDTVVAVLALGTGEEGLAREAAVDFLDRLPTHRLVPGLLAGLDDDGLPVRRESIRRLREYAAGDRGYDPEAADRADAVAAWREWWLRRAAPRESPEAIVRALSDPSPRERFEAARRAADRKDDAVIEALVGRLGEESVRYVLDKVVEALRATTGREFGYERRAPAEERAAALERWAEWWRAERGRRGS